MRLKKIAYFESLYYDMEKNYDEVDQYLQSINELIESININMSIDELKDILYESENIYSDIYYNIDVNKGYGQDNENTLYSGRDMIDKLENDRDELFDRLSELENEIDNIKYDIDHFASKKRLITKYSVRKFICTTHDEIMDACSKAKEFCDQYYDLLSDEEIQITEKLITEIINTLLDYNSEISNGINEARESNNDMNNGIDNDNNEVEKLEKEIFDLNDEIDEKTSELEELQDQLNELKNEGN